MPNGMKYNNLWLLEFLIIVIPMIGQTKVSSQLRVFTIGQT